MLTRQEMIFDLMKIGGHFYRGEYSPIAFDVKLPDVEIDFDQLYQIAVERHEIAPLDEAGVQTVEGLQIAFDEGVIAERLIEDTLESMRWWYEHPQGTVYAMPDGDSQRTINISYAFTGDNLGWLIVSGLNNHLILPDIWQNMLFLDSLDYWHYWSDQEILDLWKMCRHLKFWCDKQNLYDEFYFQAAFELFVNVLPAAVREVRDVEERNRKRLEHFQAGSGSLNVEGDLGNELE